MSRVSERRRQDSDADGRLNLPIASVVKIPRQRRSVRMVHDILDGAMRAIERDGMAAFNTNVAAKEAGVSVGTLYQYFANKEMIVAGIVERSVLGSQELVRQAFATQFDMPVDELMRMIMLGMIESLEPYMPLMQEILTGMPLLARTAVPTVVENAVSNMVRAYMSRHADRYGPVDEALLYVSLNSTIYMFLKWMVEQPAHVPRGDFVDALVTQSTAPFALQRAS